MIETLLIIILLPLALMTITWLIVVMIVTVLALYESYIQHRGSKNDKQGS
jgi:Ni,Fe-hydrogenase I cytochrome b subunit